MDLAYKLGDLGVSIRGDSENRATDIEKRGIYELVAYALEANQKVEGNSAHNQTQNNISPFLTQTNK